MVQENKEDKLELDTERIDLPKIESADELSKVIQALVFASPDVVTIKKLREVLGTFITPEVVSSALQNANDSLNKINAPFEIVEQAGGYRFRTRVAYYPFVRQLFPEMNARRLSQAALETLAVIAYQQPITKAAIENVRGVSCDAPIRGLLEKKFIALGPRVETVGNPYTYVTTPDFMKYFGINKIPEDLPRLREFQELISAGLLVPQYRHEEEKQEEANNNQVELSIGNP